MTAAQIPPNTAVVVGNPKPASRTLAAATLVARELAGAEPGLVVDLAALGPAALDWHDDTVADLVVCAGPTYKGTHTGLLKLFLDRFAGGTGLRGITVPLTLGASPAHALASEHTLRPVLTEPGGTIPGRGVYLLDTAHDDPQAYAEWLCETRPLLAALLAARTCVDNTTGEPE
jgi:FMN reductase